jgi:nucleoside-triphosphatase THEP1
MTMKCFWREISSIAFAVDALLGRPRSSETEIGDLEVAAKVNEYVGRLEVQMDEVAVVDELQALHKIRSCVHQLCDRLTNDRSRSIFQILKSSRRPLVKKSFRLPLSQYSVSM